MKLTSQQRACHFWILLELVRLGPASLRQAAKSDGVEMKVPEMNLAPETDPIRYSGHQSRSHHPVLPKLQRQL